MIFNWMAFGFGLSNCYPCFVKLFIVMQARYGRSIYAGHHTNPAPCSLQCPENSVLVLQTTQPGTNIRQRFNHPTYQSNQLETCNENQNRNAREQPTHIGACIESRLNVRYGAARTVVISR